jgi:hypothetical protein
MTRSARVPSAGRNWISLKKNISLAGTIRSVEITHGMNGWHPHLHALVYVRGDPRAEGLAALAVDVRSRWERFIADVAPTRPHPGTAGARLDAAERDGAAGVGVILARHGYRLARGP